MHSRPKTLQRLTALYEVVERANGLALDQARGGLRQAEMRIEQQASISERLSALGSEALQVGDLVEWRLDAAQVELLEMNRETLHAVRRAREEQMRAAATLYQASRMQMEQMESVLGEARAELERERARTEQRASDDRFLSRRRWTQQTLSRKHKGAQGSFVSGSLFAAEPWRRDPINE